MYIELLKVVSKILELYFLILSHFFQNDFPPCPLVRYHTANILSLSESLVINQKSQGIFYCFCLEKFRIQMFIHMKDNKLGMH